MCRSWSSLPARAARRSALVLALLAAGCGTLSVPEERELGDEFERAVRREYVFVRDPLVLGYVRDIGRDILRASAPHPFEYSFEVVEDPEINAFAGPAGHVYIHTGTVLKARNVSELAGVMAHEIGHVAERHIAQNYNRQRSAGLAHRAAVLATAILAGGQAAGATNLLGGLAGMAYLNRFTREAEAEADRFAIEVLPEAGYDPRGMVSFFQTMQSAGGVHVPAFLSSHPTNEQRIAAARRAIAERDLPPDLLVHDNGKLEIIQRRIRLLVGDE